MLNAWTILFCSLCDILYRGGALVFQAGYHPRKRIFKTHPKHVFFRYENRPVFLNLSVMSIQKFVNMTKNIPFFPILHVFAPLNDVRTYIALSWKTITWIFLRGWYPTSDTSGPPGLSLLQTRNLHTGYLQQCGKTDPNEKRQHRWHWTYCYSWQSFANAFSLRTLYLRFRIDLHADRRIWNACQYKNHCRNWVYNWATCRATTGSFLNPTTFPFNYLR